MILQIREANGFSVALCECARAGMCIMQSDRMNHPQVECLPFRAHCNFYSLNVWHNTRSLTHTHDMARGQPIAVNVLKFSDLIPFCVTEKRTHPNWDLYTFIALHKKATNNYIKKKKIMQNFCWMFLFRRNHSSYRSTLPLYSRICTHLSANEWMNERTSYGLLAKYAK